MSNDIRTEELELPIADGSTMTAHLAVPTLPGPHGAVMVLQEIFGVNAHIRDVTDRVAREGYVAIAPDYHHRVLHGAQLPYNDEGRKRGMEALAALTLTGLRADLDATVAALRARKDVRGDRLGAMGFCLGGHAAYIAAEELGLRATAAFYGGGIAKMSPGGGAPTVTKTGQIKGRIECYFGGKDSHIGMDQVDAIRAAFREHHTDGEVVVYPEADHAFFRDVGATYDPKASADAWERVKKMFAAQLR